MDQQRHEMVLEKSYPTGADEWYCPTCGRRLLMMYQPNFKKTVLNAGDEFAAHSGGKGGIRMSAAHVMTDEDLTSENEPRISLQDPSLAPWVAWLTKVNFENWWDENGQ